MKSLCTLLFALVLGAAALPAMSIVAPVTMTEAQACDVQMGRRNSCHQGYLDSCRQYGPNNPMCLQGNRGGQRYGHRPTYHRPVYQQRPMYGHQQQRRTMYGHQQQRRVYRTVPVNPVHVGGPAPSGMPHPQAVYERQLQAGNVTRTRVPCADGFVTLANGNCGRWVQN